MLAGEVNRTFGAPLAAAEGRELADQPNRIAAADERIEKRFADRGMSRVLVGDARKDALDLGKERLDSAARLRRLERGRIRRAAGRSGGRRSAAIAGEYAASAGLPAGGVPGILKFEIGEDGAVGRAGPGAFPLPETLRERHVHFGVTRYTRSIADTSRVSRPNSAR